MAKYLKKAVPWKIALAVLLLSELVWVVVLFQMHKPGPHLGFLVKDGARYILVWRTDEEGIQTRHEDSIDSAVSYARNSLNLKVGVNPIPEHELEYLSVVDRYGSVQVLWKTSRINFLNQITFHRSADARFFAKAFKSGAYSPSPFGHSILLVPIHANN